MPDPTTSPDARALADLGWVRSLARSLTRDPAAADDLAQDATVAALHQPAVAHSRAWGASVVKNLWRQALRAGQRRTRRETRAARPEGVPATDDLVARAETQRALMAHVLALDEPYRSTLLLRFFEGLAPREIARRTQTPVATVQSRLARALHTLRARLDTAHGRQQWLGALAPLCTHSWWPVVTAAGISMKTKTVVVTAVVAVAVSMGAYATLGSRTPTPDSDDRGIAVPAAASLGGAGGGGSGGAGHADAARRTALTPRQGAEPGARDPGFRAHGTVFLADGTPGAGIALALRADPTHEVARSGAGGVFELQAHTSPVALVAADPRFVTLREGVYQREAPQRAVVVVAPGYAFGGRVVDENQRPLPGAHLRLSLPADWAARFATDMEASQDRTFTARTTAGGRFAFTAVPNLPGCTLRAVLDGYASAEVGAPELARDDLEIVLTRPTATATGAVRGRVLTHDGAGAGGARVALGLTSVLADDKGFFALDLARAVTSEQLRAVLQGMQPAILDRPAGDRWPDYIELRLGPPALRIRGVIVDHEGKPVDGARVWLADATAFGMMGRMPMEAEGLAAGAVIPPQALESAANLPAEDGDNYWDYTMSKPKPFACWNYATTDSSGHFELPGLAARAYRLRVMVDATLQLATSVPIAAGTEDARIALDAPELWESFEARVVSNGAPIANVEVSLRCRAHDVQARAFGGRVELCFDFPGARTRTDAEGRFKLPDVPKHGCFLVMRGETIIPHSHTLTPTLSARGTDIEVEGRCQLRVDLAPPLDRADAIALVDGEGQPLDILVLSFGSTNATTDLPLHAGKSAPFSCSTRARRLILQKNGEPIDSLDLPLLRAGDSHTVGR